MLGDKKITGEMPVLEVDLTHCERGAPCEYGRAPNPGPRTFTCRIHAIRHFLKELGWVEDVKKDQGAA